MSFIQQLDKAIKRLLEESVFANYGAWITPEGKIIPVRTKVEHDKTAAQLLRRIFNIVPAFKDERSAAEGHSRILMSKGYILARFSEPYFFNSHKPMDQAVKPILTALKNLPFSVEIVVGADDKNFAGTIGKLRVRYGLSKDPAGEEEEAPALKTKGYEAPPEASFYRRRKHGQWSD